MTLWLKLYNLNLTTQELKAVRLSEEAGKDAGASFTKLTYISDVSFEKKLCYKIIFFTFEGQAKNTMVDII
jgi:hypothetical protein